MKKVTKKDRILADKLIQEVSDTLEDMSAGDLTLVYDFILEQAVNRFAKGDKEARALIGHMCREGMEASSNANGGKIKLVI